MPPTLPRPRARNSSGLVARASLAALVLGACRKPPPPVAPGPPIPAEADVVVGSMHDECGALLGAFDTWKRCPNLDETGRANLDAWRDHAKLSFDAGEKTRPEPKADHAMALACRRGLVSVGAAIERCGNGKAPREE